MSELANAMLGVTHPFRLSQRRSFVSALAIESLLIGGLIAYVVSHPPSPTLNIIPLSIEAEEIKPVPEPEVKPQIPEPPKPVTRVQQLPQVTPRPQITPQPTAVVPTETPSQSTSVPTEVAPLAPPPSTVTAKSDVSAEYLARVKAAVQTALIFPPAAAALNFRGRARVEFHLRDGTPSQAHILASSGMGLTDRAALQSVEKALYPPPPGSLQGRDETYQIWVEFHEQR